MPKAKQLVSGRAEIQTQSGSRVHALKHWYNLWYQLKGTTYKEKC